MCPPPRRRRPRRHRRIRQRAHRPARRWRRLPEPRPAAASASARRSSARPRSPWWRRRQHRLASRQASFALGLGGGSLTTGFSLLGQEHRIFVGATARHGCRVALGVDVAALFDGVGDDPAHEAGRADGVVVARDRVLHDIGVDVRIDHGDDRDAELVRLGDGEVLLLRVEDEHRFGPLGEAADTAEVLLQLRELTTEEERLLLRHRIELSGGAHALVLLHLRRRASRWSRSS